MDSNDPNTEIIAETKGRTGTTQRGLLNLATADMEFYKRNAGIDEETNEPQTELIIKSDLPTRQSETRLTVPTRTLQKAFCED